MDLVLAEFHKACIYTVPKHIHYSEVSPKLHFLFLSHLFQYLQWHAIIVITQMLIYRPFSTKRIEQILGTFSLIWTWTGLLLSPIQSFQTPKDFH